MQLVDSTESVNVWGVPHQGNMQTRRSKKGTGNFCNSHCCISPSLQAFSDRVADDRNQIGGGRASIRQDQAFG